MLKLRRAKTSRVFPIAFLHTQFDGSVFGFYWLNLLSETQKWVSDNIFTKIYELVCWVKFFPAYMLRIKFSYVAVFKISPDVQAAASGPKYCALYHFCYCFFILSL